MPNLVIVAIPAKDDYIHKISSEKVAHMTLLFLGEVSQVKNFAGILDYVKHAADTSLTSFGMDVERRDVLGEEKADVLFFSKSKWSGFDQINDYRSYLLKNDNIRIAYDSVEQFPEWRPHITLGYPDTPAKPDNRDYPGITHVGFDRIAVWFGDYEGIEFPLKTRNWEAEVSMSEEIVQNILAHFGVRGMRWGVRRKATVGPREVIVSDKRKKLKTSGGQGRPASGDAVRARTLGQVGRKSGLKALSDQELQAYSRRLNLEQQVKRLEYNEKSAAKKFVLRALGKAGSQTIDKVTDDASNKARLTIAAKMAAAAA